MSVRSTTYKQVIDKIYPHDLLENTIDYRTKGIKKLDPRKTCLDCGYLRHVSIQYIGQDNDGNPLYQRNEDDLLLPHRISILTGDKNQLEAMYLDCYRAKWSCLYSGENKDRLKKGLKNATRKRVCNTFFPFSPDESAEVHRTLHRERTAIRGNMKASFIGALLGGALTLIGTFLGWYLGTK
jgi:hypothetical protein